MNLQLITYCNNCRGEMGSVLVRERHAPVMHPEAKLDDNDDWSSPPGDAVIEMTGLLYCEGCNANPGTTIVLSPVDEITMKEV